MEKIVTLESTAKTIARAIFDRIERDGNIVLASLEEAALSVLAVEAERNKATMTELSPLRRPTMAEIASEYERDIARKNRENELRARADFIKQYMVEPGPIARTLRDHAIKQGLVPDLPRMTNVAGAEADTARPTSLYEEIRRRQAAAELGVGIGKLGWGAGEIAVRDSDIGKRCFNAADGSEIHDHEIRSVDVARDGRASS